MNPIVKKLAEQAGMNIKTNVIGTPLVFGTFEGYKTSHITTEELEMFAELIVKKCAELAEECYCGDTVKWMLLTRFGVEP